MYPERGAKNFRNVFTGGGGVIRNFNLLLGGGGNFVGRMGGSRNFEVNIKTA